METMYPTYSQEATNAMLSKFLKEKEKEIKYQIIIIYDMQLMVNTLQNEPEIFNFFYHIDQPWIIFQIYIWFQNLWSGNFISF